MKPFVTLSSALQEYMKPFEKIAETFAKYIKQLKQNFVDAISIIEPPETYVPTKITLHEGIHQLALKFNQTTSYSSGPYLCINNNIKIESTDSKTFVGELKKPSDSTFD